jgi:hypothetical protein
MKVTYLRGALRDLNSIFEYISEDDPIATQKVIGRIREVADLLAVDQGGEAGGFFQWPDCPMSSFIASRASRCRSWRSSTLRGTASFE